MLTFTTSIQNLTGVCNWYNKEKCIKFQKLEVKLSLFITDIDVYIHYPEGSQYT